MSGLPPGLSARRLAFGAQLTADPPAFNPAASSSSAPLPPPFVPAAPPTQPPRPPKGQARQPKSTNEEAAQSGPTTATTTPRQKKAKSKANRSKEVEVAKIIAVATPIEEDDGSMCFLCAETVQYWAVGECEHRTCHVCSVRLRCLYKRTDCTFCKHECPRVVFTASPTALFSSLPASSTPFSDAKLGLAFETREQMEDTLALLRFNCPSSTCPSILLGWSDLKRHTRNDHNLALCDFCCTNKKIFTHEHELYTNEGLGKHMDDNHPYCGFCRIHFYDSDLLYAHCRDRHEECFICTRQGIRHQYHLNYDRLEAHFKSNHYICPHPDCLAQKFVVFESELDLQAHAVASHNAAFSGDQRARRDARRIETNFTYEADQSSSEHGSRSNSNRGGSRANGRAGGGRTTEADFVDGQLPLGRRVVPGLGATRPDRAAPQSSTGHDAPPHRIGNGNGGSGSHTPVELPVPSNADALVLERHAALMRRVTEALSSPSRVSSFKLAVRSYKGSEMSAGDFVDSLFNMFDRKSELAGGIISSVADLFEEGDKRGDLLRAWQDLRVEQNQFPSLAPIAPALDGIPIAPAPSSFRALNSTSVRNQHNPAIWSAVERAALSSTPIRAAPARERFPALAATAPTAINRNLVPGMARTSSNKSTGGGARATPWASSTASGSGSRSTTPNPPPTSSSSSFNSFAAPSLALFVEPSKQREAARPTPRTTRAEFPSLPTSMIEADKRARIRQALTRPSATPLINSAASSDERGRDGGSWIGGGSSSSTRNNSRERDSRDYQTAVERSMGGSGNVGGVAGVVQQQQKKKKPQKITLSMNAGRGAN